MDSILVWFRRDLRHEDNAALSEALRRGRKVHCAFIFDLDILDALPSPVDRRVEFIRESLLELDSALRAAGGGLIIRQGRPSEAIPEIATALGVSAVFANRDYEPSAKQRDASVEDALARRGIALTLLKDQAVFDGPEVLTQAGRPYTVFTPYRNAWLKRLGEDDTAPYPADLRRLASSPMAQGVPPLAKIGFAPADLKSAGLSPGMSGAKQGIKQFLPRLAQYHQQRDYPATEGTSALSPHLRFGTVSIRTLVRLAVEAGALCGNTGAASWLSELIWRDFYFMILDQFPHVTERAFKPAFDRITWDAGDQADAHFAAWCAGQTGYPLIDAAMRHFAATGNMHNRLRMLVASFLTKDLGIDWRRGEAWFASLLNDFDLSANNGGWQWAASSGCDAQPWFRIFNPVTQSERFDPEGRFIRRHLPALAGVPDRHIHAPWRMTPVEQAACGVIIGRDTPPPLVEHDKARRKALARYETVR